MLVHKLNTTIVPVFFFHKGCRDRCSFCNQFSMVSDGLGPDPKEDLYDHLKGRLEHVQKRGNIEVAYFGGTFTNMTQSEMLFYLMPARRLMEEGLIDGIRVSTRPDRMNKKTAKFLKENNVTAVCLGIESVFEDVLFHANRHYNRECAEQSIKSLKEEGINVVAQIMLGLPKDSPQKSMKTLLWSASQPIDGIRVCPVLVLKDTGLHALYKDKKFVLWNDEVFYHILEEAVILFFKHGIPILRFGLCLDRAVRESCAAGLMHDSLGDYVEYRTVFRALKTLVKNGNMKSVRVHPLLKGYLRGYGRENERRLFDELMIESLEFSADGIRQEDIKNLYQK